MTTSTSSTPKNVSFRVAVPAHIYFDVAALEGTSNEEIQRLAVEQLVSLRAHEGVDIIEGCAMRAYPKDDFTTTDISVEWGAE